MKFALRLALLSIMIFMAAVFSSCRKKNGITPVKVIPVEISPSILAIAINDKNPRKVYAKNKDTYSEISNVRWSSENADIAKISEDGFITGLAIGETNIIATVTDGSGTAKCRVVVFDTTDYKFRITLKDKGPVNFSFSKPQDYLSARALARRSKMSISIDSSDIPISSEYLNQIEKIGGKIVAKSKWLKTVSVHCPGQYFVEKYKALPFVKDVTLVWAGKKDTTAYLKTLIAVQPLTFPRSVAASEYYGVAWDNINMNKGQYLHDNGFKGAGMEIAVLDAGFRNLPTNVYLNTITIKGAKSFVYELTDPYSYGNHGVYVTSIMATNRPNSYVGTAPEAAYWLLMTEDETTEFPIEEDYLVAGLEYADSVGADAVNISLAYKDYETDKPPYSYKYEDMNGNTAQASKGANAAASRGLLIVCAAGNDRSWVGTPSDSPEILTVGGIDRAQNISSFSSFGMTIDGRIKPDVLALATGNNVVSINGGYTSGSGTSFASPIMCGLATCLWQAYPKLTNKEIIKVIKQSANRYTAPILPYGYGIPDMQIAMQLAKALSDTK